jgi:hypothetical protein
VASGLRRHSLDPRCSAREASAVSSAGRGPHRYLVLRLPHPVGCPVLRAGAHHCPGSPASSALRCGLPWDHPCVQVAAASLVGGVGNLLGVPAVVAAVWCAREAVSSTWPYGASRGAVLQCRNTPVRYGSLSDGSASLVSGSPWSSSSLWLFTPLEFRHRPGGAQQAAGLHQPWLRPPSW